MKERSINSVKNPRGSQWLAAMRTCTNGIAAGLSQHKTKVSSSYITYSCYHIRYIRWKMNEIPVAEVQRPWHKQYSAEWQSDRPPNRQQCPIVYNSICTNENGIKLRRKTHWDIQSHVHMAAVCDGFMFSLFTGRHNYFHIDFVQF